MKIRKFEIHICNGCLELSGASCNTPECVFCWRTTDEVSNFLDVLLIRPIIDGEHIREVLCEI